MCNFVRHHHTMCGDEVQPTMCEHASMTVAPSETVVAERLSADERREALLDVAKVLIDEVGPGAITMGVVADRAGVTRALVYKHFANKHDLLVALYRREARRIDRAIRAEVDAAPEQFEPKLRAFIGATLDLLDEHGPFFTPLREAGADQTARGDQRGRDQRTVRYFAGLAEREFGIEPHTARSVIAVLFSGIRSLRAQMRSRPGDAQRAFLLDTYVEMTIGALTRLAERAP
jgi:AcrR family transcriptional regulator